MGTSMFEAERFAVCESASMEVAVGAVSSVDFASATTTGRASVNGDFVDGSRITRGGKASSENFVHWPAVCSNCS